MLSTYRLLTPTSCTVATVDRNRVGVSFQVDVSGVLCCAPIWFRLTLGENPLCRGATLSSPVHVAAGVHFSMVPPRARGCGADEGPMMTAKKFAYTLISGHQNSRPCSRPAENRAVIGCRNGCQVAR
jgi:hypothetical protein